MSLSIYDPSDVRLTDEEVDRICDRTDAMLATMTSASAIAFLFDTHTMCLQHAKVCSEKTALLLATEFAIVCGILERLDPQAFADGLAVLQEGL